MKTISKAEDRCNKFAVVQAGEKYYYVRSPKYDICWDIDEPRVFSRLVIPMHTPYDVAALVEGNNEAVRRDLHEVASKVAEVLDMDAAAVTTFVEEVFKNPLGAIGDFSDIWLKAVLAATDEARYLHELELLKLAFLRRALKLVKRRDVMTIDMVKAYSRG
ncbi:MAG: hypothetical protein ACK4SY_07575 [Pyrobaculum sp.]